jgi:choline dehydrogenase-like flavoprotein
VLLLEAGGSDRNLNIKIPAAFANQFHTKLDWDYRTEPEPYVDDRELYVPRGKSLGGSSSMNAMLYVRGRPLDYDSWQAEGWDYHSVLPYFLRSEDNVRGPSEFHATGGPLRVEEQHSPRHINADFLQAAQANGMPNIADYNGPEQDGSSMFQVTQRDGRRWSAADAFLRPARDRKNLSVVTRAQVTTIELAGGRATGITYRDRFKRTHTAHANREVILCAGAIGSPQLLLLSGIGPADELQAIGITARHDLPGVGRNLQDHPFITMIYEINDTHSLYGADKPKPLAEWMLRRSGPLTSTAAEAVAFVRTRPGLPAADIQFHFGAMYYEDHGQETFEGHAMTIAPTLVSPRSRGRLWLRSDKPGDKPRILTNSLSEPEDVASLTAGMDLAEKLANTEPLASKVVRRLKPESANDLEAELRRRVELIYHPVGTCSIGSVVDASLRVIGVDALRVVDASVMPVIPGGNTNAPTIMVAERAADLIRGAAA